MLSDLLTVVSGWLPLVFAIVALVLFLRRRQPVFRSFGFSVSRWTLADLGVGLLIPAVSIGLVFVVEWALGAIGVSDGTTTWSGLLNDVLGQLLIAAVLEELIYRVGLLSGVAAALDRVPYGRWIAVLATGALFGAAHLGNEGASWVAAVGTGLGGVIYGIAFLATRSIWLPIALHFSWNVSQGLFGFPISGHTVPGFASTQDLGPEILTGGAYGPEAGIPGMLARFVIIALLFVYLKRRNPGGSIATLRFEPDPRRRSRTAAPATAG
ncbi:CPBP family intramembrane glutamic endopeptidase [Agromyces sp. PvR057]|uniref:CPBP family intramembrane glutamic endopeptidase n=1 Tax=Agromyces sp. PvR057 TaxID=3156403 RepID=UPI00339B07C1